MAHGRTLFEQIALLLQGGGALGAYQAGVYEALAEADLHPDWVAGISIGAINSAIIAGNPPERRVDALREFWQMVCTSPLGVPYFRGLEYGDIQRQLVNQTRAMNILLFGAPNFFVPRMPPPTVWPPAGPDKASYYDNAPLRATLERLVDFDRINGGEIRFSVGAVDSLMQIPLTVDGIYNWEGGKWHPFVGAGLGWHFLRFTSDLPTSDIDNTDTRVGFNVGGGVEYFLNRTLAVRGEGRYYALEDARGEEPSGMALTIGLKTYF